jgi:hypothetical protein
LPIFSVTYKEADRGQNVGFHDVFRANPYCRASRGLSIWILLEEVQVFQDFLSKLDASKVKLKVWDYNHYDLMLNFMQPVTALCVWGSKRT